MYTIADARSWAIGELQRARIESPALTADLLLGFVLGRDRVYLLSHREEALADEARNRIEHLTTLRARRKPLQHLTGEQEFYGLGFSVSPDVLIPRPETEILVEKALELLATSLPPRARFVDIGVGSGCIAISVAHGSPSSIGWALDLSAAALRVARQNAARHQVSEKILLIQSDLLDCFSPRPYFHLILCNPPYVALTECDSLQPEVRDHEPHQALFGGESGLDIYARLLPEASLRLVPGGFLLLEVGAGQASEVGGMIEKAALHVEMTLDDLQGIPRCVVGRKPLEP